MPKMNDDHTPATKKDLRDLEWRIAATIDAQLEQSEGRIDAKMSAKLEELESRLTRHFTLVAENLVHDFQGIFKDRLEQHEDRLTRLEQHTGLATA